MRAKSVQWVRAVAFAVVRGAAVVLGCVGIWMLLSQLLGQVVPAVVPSNYRNGQPTGFPNWLHAFLYSAAFRHGVTLLVIAGAARGAERVDSAVCVPSSGACVPRV